MNHQNENTFEDVSAAVEEAKRKLIQILNNHSNVSSDSKVAAAVDELSQKWWILQERRGAEGSGEQEIQEAIEHHRIITKLPGKWIQISAPIFPNAIKDPDAPPGKGKYTLGRLSFNMFQPKNLVCTLEGTMNTVRPHAPTSTTDQGQSITGTYTYDILQRLTVHTERGDLPATLLVKGKCHADPNKKDRVSVTFTAGELRRGEEVNGNSHMRKIWDDTFSDAYATADKERGYIASFAMWFMKIAFQMTFPTDARNGSGSGSPGDDEDSSCCARYEMKRAPKGYLDVLYIDEDLRITRGNRGTAVIVKKEKQ